MITETQKFLIIQAVNDCYRQEFGEASWEDENDGEKRGAFFIRGIVREALDKHLKAPMVDVGALRGCWSAAIAAAYKHCIEAGDKHDFLGVMQQAFDEWLGEQMQQWETSPKPLQAAKQHLYWVLMNTPDECLDDSDIILIEALNEDADISHPPKPIP